MQYANNFQDGKRDFINITGLFKSYKILEIISKGKWNYLSPGHVTDLNKLQQNAIFKYEDNDSFTIGKILDLFLFSPHI